MSERFTKTEKEAVTRLISYAKEKPFVADLLVNGYNSSFAKPDMFRVMRYAAGEPAESTYKADVFTFLELIGRGIETHELVGTQNIKKILGWITPQGEI